MFGFRKHLLLNLRDHFFHSSTAAPLIPDVWIPICRDRRRGSNGVAHTLLHLVVAPLSFLEKSAVQGKSLQGSLSGPAYPVPRREGQDRSRVTPSALAVSNLRRPNRPNQRQSGNSKTARPKKRPPKNRTLNPAIWPVLGQATRHLPCNARAKLPWSGFPPGSVTG